MKKKSIWNCKIRKNIVTGHETGIDSYELETKQQFTVWMFPGEPNRAKNFLSRSTSKKITACFFDLTGHIETIQLQYRKTVNAKW